MKLKHISPNCTEVDLGQGRKVLFSYDTAVAYTEVTEEGRMFYQTDAKHSKTTAKHIKSWMPVEQAAFWPQNSFDTLIDTLYGEQTA